MKKTVTPKQSLFLSFKPLTIAIFISLMMFFSLFIFMLLFFLSQGGIPSF